jgi:hypothetical protein
MTHTHLNMSKYSRSWIMSRTDEELQEALQECADMRWTNLSRQVQVEIDTRNVIHRAVTNDHS